MEAVTALQTRYAANPKLVLDEFPFIICDIILKIIFIKIQKFLIN
jgi:hypothetical protein